MNWRLLATAALVNAALALLALAAGAVNVSGVVGGFFIGVVILYSGGWAPFGVLLIFFLMGSAATRLGYSRKAALGVAQEGRGRRGAGHAFANCGASVAALVLYRLADHPEAAADSWALVAYAAAFATALFDTVSSEIGQLYGRRPFLATTLRRVPVGTEGAVSVEGTAAGLAAAMLLAGAGGLFGLYGGWGILFVTAGAFIGTTFESIIGAVGTRRRSINNELLNFANTVVGGAAAALLLYLFSK